MTILYHTNIRIMQLIKVLLLSLSLSSEIKHNMALQIPRKVFLRSVKSYISKTILNDDSERSQTEIKIEDTKDTKDTKDTETPLMINFYSQVTAETCIVLTTMLRKMDAKSKELEQIYGFRIPIKLHIQSLGGELMPSFYVCDLIQNLETPVHTYVDGYAASAASLIAICGEKRFMTKHSSILIHQLKSSSAGKFNEMRDEMSNLNSFMNNLKDIYLEHSNIDEAELEKLFLSDIWLSSTKCLSLGLVDEII